MVALTSAIVAFGCRGAEESGVGGGGGSAGDGGGPAGGGGGSAGGGGSSAGGGGTCGAPGTPALDVEAVLASGEVVAPTFVTAIPGEDAVAVVEQGGRILRVETDQDGEVSASSFHTMEDRVGAGGERGLLGLAFHPDFPTDPRFYVYYTPSDAMQNVVAEYRAAGEPPMGQDAEIDRLVEFTDPDTNHNGGMLVFGSDGRLYVGTGDGGGGNDDHGEFGNGLDLSQPMGKILRLDVDSPETDYAPADNPFVGLSGLDIVWAYGLRNPWRFSFDRQTGDLYIGDVGQDREEEIDFVALGLGAGLNFGWRAYEGNYVLHPEDVDRVPEHHSPILTVLHADNPDADDEIIRNPGCIIGGHVYRGSRIPGLGGYYLFGDCQSGDIAAFRVCDGNVFDLHRLPGLRDRAFGLTSFGEDAEGELFMTYGGSGAVYRIVEAL